MKIFTSIWMVVVFAVVLTGIRIDNSDTVKTMRYKTWDHFQYVQPRQEVSDTIVVVDITEEDLKKYGQWPWPRHTMAAFHARLTDAGAILVNYNILFADPDRMSGKEYLKSMPMENELREQLGKVLPDTDAIFSYVMKERNNAVLMMSVNHKESNVLPRTTPIIQKGDALPWLYSYPGLVVPNSKVAAGANAIGVMVTAPEPDAVVRKMPMLIRVGQKVYPNMILENVRILNKSKRIKVISKQHGIDEILVKKDAGIPVNHNAEMYINYAEPINYPHMTSDQVFTKQGLDKVRGKIVVVGLDAAGLRYLKYTPHGLTTDQMITAQALDTTLTGKHLFRLAQADTYEIVFLAFLLLLLILVLPRTSVLLAVPLLLFVEVGVAYGAFMAYANKGFLVDPSWMMLSVFLIWSHSVYNNFATQSRLKQQIKKQFEHYLDPGMVKKLQKDPSLLKLGGETRNMTFLFCDIRGFTPISEKYKDDPAGLTRLINRFLTRMTDVIIANGGTIDKFMGDCIMAFWNAPIENRKHREAAIQTSLDMIHALLHLNTQLAAEGFSEQIQIGIGINSGDALVGNMGSDQRFDYSVIGDPVNLAARLESASKTLGKTIVIGGDTRHTIETSFPFEYIDSITVKGKTETVKVYTIKE